MRRQLVKIVQRVPVRIASMHARWRRNPAEIGLSMKADVDVSGGTGGARLPQLAKAAAAGRPRFSARATRLADARVQAIIAANRSAPAHALAERAAVVTNLLASAQLAGAARHLHH